MEEEQEETYDEKRNRRYMDLFHQKQSRYLDDLLTTEEE
jgi:hypothetical protein